MVIGMVSFFFFQHFGTLSQAVLSLFMEILLNKTFNHVNDTSDRTKKLIQIISIINDLVTKCNIIKIIKKTIP